MHAGSTIAAISSPPGAARRGVIRISGPRAGGILAHSCQVEGRAVEPGPRAVFTARFHDGLGEQPALVLWMPGPRSFTREDVVELHLPGSPFLLDRALRRVLELGAEPAAPGEYTRRAFLNGRIDLTRAEGVLALVSARGEEERRAATALLFGGLGERMQGLREALETLRALCEASLDFDDADTGHVPTSELLELARGVGAGIDEALTYEERRTPHAGEPRIVLVGEPNAGKSSLFNRLVKGERALDRALVSDEAGTTRDAKGALWTVAGRACRLVDTAGRARPDGGVEAEAQRHAERESLAADVLLWVVDAAGPPDVATTARLSEFAGRTGSDALLVLIWNKTDLPGARPLPEPGSLPGVRERVEVSAHTGTGIEALGAAVRRVLEPDGTGAAHGGVGRELYARHRDALERAAGQVREATHALQSGVPLDLVAETLRAATDELDRISGRTTPEDLLDRIFARFCLGK